MKREKKIVIIAGPNGAGKTTFAREFLPNEAGSPGAATCCARGVQENDSCLTLVPKA
jgi:ABC-type Mn2+/Zn2+ transport system ATPase subunit